MRENSERKINEKREEKPGGKTVRKKMLEEKTTIGKTESGKTSIRKTVGG